MSFDSNGAGKTAHAEAAADPSLNLIDRYLHAIGKHLPGSRREDILAELSANMAAEVEDREAVLGRSLTPGEQSELLKQHGRPFLVAAGYRTQQYLIGPVVFPYYLQILKIALTISAFVNLLASAILLALHGVTAMGVVGMVARLPFSLLVTAGWVTAVFVALELAISRYPALSPVHSAWKPESLPPVVPGSRSRLKGVADLLVHLGGVLWLAAVPHYPYLALGPGAGYFTGGPVRATAALHAMYWPIVALLFVPLVVKAALLGKSLMPRQRLVVSSVSSAIGLVVFALAIRVRDYFTVVGTAPEQAKYRHAVEVYTSITSVSLRVGFAICLSLLLWEIGKYFLKGPAARDMGRALAC